jgi:hypothetical protein
MPLGFSLLGGERGGRVVYSMDAAGAQQAHTTTCGSGRWLKVCSAHTLHMRRNTPAGDASVLMQALHFVQRGWTENLLLAYTDTHTHTHTNAGMGH